MLILFLIPYAVLFGWMIYQQIISKKKAGRILFDVTSVNAKWFVLALGYIYSLSALYYLYNMVVTGFENWDRTGDFSTILANTYFGIYFLYLGYSRLRVHENGIMLYSSLVKWERIESFAWEPENKKTWFLTLRYPGKLPALLRELILYIPAAKKDEFAALLEQYAFRMSLKGEK